MALAAGLEQERSLDPGAAWQRDGAGHVGEGGGGWVGSGWGGFAARAEGGEDGPTARGGAPHRRRLRVGLRLEAVCPREKVRCRRRAQRPIQGGAVLVQLSLADLRAVSMLGRGAKGVVFHVVPEGEGGAGDVAMALKSVSREAARHKKSGGSGGGNGHRRIWFECDALRWEDVEVGEPGDGEIQIWNTAIGVNFIDIYFRKGVYPAPLPFTPVATQTNTVPLTILLVDTPWFDRSSVGVNIGAAAAAVPVGGAAAACGGAVAATPKGKPSSGTTP
ncbi:hypothetical protein VPH35_051121 [Triticum aestivum]|uniref:Enoyl reductase (ER) domain-containing protein n=1 Tax=Triticum aestivum TaxID=4565 RepID=A0A077RR35_WHEAT|nr:unnamed protein product [Triticum aestivum]